MLDGLVMVSWVHCSSQIIPQSLLSFLLPFSSLCLHARTSVYDRVVQLKSQSCFPRPLALFRSGIIDSTERCSLEADRQVVSLLQQHTDPGPDPILIFNDGLGTVG